MHNVSPRPIISPMSSTQNPAGPSFKRFRNDRIYEDFTEIIEISSDFIQAGDRILEAEAWSSHGMKDASWVFVANADEIDRVYYGPTVIVARTTKSIAR